MNVQVPLLTFSQAPDIDGSRCLDSHALQPWQVCYWRDHQAAGILEADESAVKQVIAARGQQQAILTVEPFFVG